MQRMARYREVLDDMLARGLAYRCYTTPAELDALRAEQLARGEKPRYDRRWRPEPGKTLPEPPPGIPPVVRFRNPLGGIVDWQDAVKGRIEIGNHELDDLIIARSDGAPTNKFCVVVDDLDMRITHVIRGDDHVNNTPRQINMIRALGGTEPVYAHLPTVLTPEGDKLSKRHGARGVLQYRDDGYLPEAVVNYLARLGWAHGDAEIFSRDEFIGWFDLAHLSPAPGRFDPDKLTWVNHEHIKQLPADELGRRLRPFLERAGLDVAAGPAPAGVAGLLRDRTPTLAEMADAAHYFYAEPAPANILARFAELMTAAVKSALPELLTAFETVDWSRESIAAAIKSVAAKCGLKTAQLMMATRAAVTGEAQTPPIDAVLALVGRERTIDRLRRGLAG
jgi:glutamyl-tRNA synthetase